MRYLNLTEIVQSSFFWNGTAISRGQYVDTKATQSICNYSFRISHHEELGKALLLEGGLEFSFIERILFLFHCLFDCNGLREVMKINGNIEMLFKILCISLNPPKGKCQY